MKLRGFSVKQAFSGIIGKTHGQKKKHSRAKTGWPNRAEGLEGLLPHGLRPKAVKQVGGAAGLARRWAARGDRIEASWALARIWLKGK